VKSLTPLSISKRLALTAIAVSPRCRFRFDTKTHSVARPHRAGLARCRNLSVEEFRPRAKARYRMDFFVIPADRAAALK